MFNLFGNNITSFMKAHTRAVIATIDAANQPSTSVIFYIVDDNDELFFITKSHTKKYQNIKINNCSAITVVDKDKPIAVNATGIVEEITDEATKDTIMQKVFKLSYSELQDYAPIIKLHKGSFSVLKFIPKEAIMTDFTKPMGEAKEDLKTY